MAPSPDFSPSRRPMTPNISSQYRLQNPHIQGVLQTIIKGRKSWKILEDGEAVWPPELEAALIEGLENYQPDASRETLLLGRFPMRNKFLSDWIFERTGKRRTTKQIGSRLQQFRDTSVGKHFFTFNAPTQRPCLPYSPYPESHHSDAATLQNVLYRGVEAREDEMPSTIVYIDLLRPDSSISADSPLTSCTSPSQAAEEHLKRGYRIVRATQYPRYMHDIDPTITLLSHSMTDARSYFTVYSKGRLIFSESTVLGPVDSTASNVDGILYKTSLVPGLWDTISQSSDASQYTIIQHVIQGSSPNYRIIFSATYKFLYQTSLPMEHTLSTPTTDSDNFYLDGLLSINNDVYADIMAFSKPPNIFDLDFMIDSWNAQCSAAEGYSQSMPNDTFDEDELSSPHVLSFLDGIDLSNYL